MPRLQAAVIIGARRFSFKSFRIVLLLFAGGDYSRAASIRYLFLMCCILTYCMLVMWYLFMCMH